jgi:hypothetical protein
VLDRTFGFDRLTVWHRRNGRVALSLLLVHAAAITTGYALGDGVSVVEEAGRLLSGYPGVITAAAGLVTLVEDPAGLPAALAAAGDGVVAPPSGEGALVRELRSYFEETIEPRSAVHR